MPDVPKVPLLPLRAWPDVCQGDTADSEIGIMQVQPVRRRVRPEQKFKFKFKLDLK